MAWTIDLSNQVSLVTGGATGIGAATCIGLAEAGSHIAVNYYPSERDRVEAKTLISKLEALGVEALGIECDVTDEAGVERMVDTIIDKWGRIDNFVSNAAIIIPAPMHELSYDTFRKVAAVSMDGTFLVSRAVIRQMLKQGCGDIVFMGSGTVLTGGGDCVAYPSAKASLEGMMSQMVNEYAALGIRVNTIRPMVIDTPIMSQRYTDEQHEEYRQRMPVQRWGTPEDVANLVVFLCDRVRSGFILGNTVEIDGGRIHHVRFRPLRPGEN